MASAAARARPQRAVNGRARARPPYESREDRRDSPGRRAAASAPGRLRAASRPRIAGGVVWIALVTVLLAGIVALNVAVLGLNMRLERLDGRKEKIQSRIAEIDSELAGISAAGRIEAAARGRLGLVEPLETKYVEVDRRRR
jgi:hypothetical protein